MGEKILKRLLFGLLGVIILLLIAATVFEKIYGAEFSSRYFYLSPIVIVLWAVVAVGGIALLLRRGGLRRRTITLMLHMSLVLILAGALVTHIFGKQGRVHLREGDAPASSYLQSDSSSVALPFTIALNSFELKYYTGSSAPMDYVSHILVDGSTEGTVSMNNIFSYRNYRFYQSSYDSDGRGTILSVSYDPWGIAVTYSGYGLLLLSVIAFFFQRNSGFRALLRSPRLRRAAVAALILAASSQATAASKEKLPQTLPESTAKEFCDMYVYYNDRICPLQTLARDFTIKLCGKDSYRGLTCEQVLTGWLFYYDDWKNEPMIKIKNSHVAGLLAIEGNRARLTDFADKNGLKIENALADETAQNRRRALEEAQEKFNVASMVSTGAMFKIYPYDDGNRVQWYSLADRLPAEMPNDQWIFIRRSMDFVAEQVAKRDYTQVEELLGKIRKYQDKTATDVLPTPSRFKAEKIYNSTNVNRPLAMACATAGILLFVCACLNIVRRKKSKGLDTVACLVMLIVVIYLSFRIFLRGYVSGHLPLSSGFETMQFMAWVVALLTLLFWRRLPMALPFGFLLTGLAMMVAMFGEANPQITHLMPVLQSPLLSIHVVVIMIAYALLSYAMLNGVTALLLHAFKKDHCRDDIEYLQALSQVILYPAVFLLAIGIFIGAVWANISWGRYWGWDPKEVWALITMLVYSFALHTSLLKPLRRPIVFHAFCVVAFLTVIITYFGVNFFMEGLHSYA